MRYYLFIFLFSLSNYGYCCTCAPQPSVTDAYNNSAKVVIGTIIDYQAVIEVDSSEYRRLIEMGIKETQAVRVTSGGFSQYTLVLLEPSYKGVFEGDTLVIRTGLTSSACGFSFQVGEKYIVYGYNPTSGARAFTPEFEYFWTDNCTRTRLFGEKEWKKLIKIASRIEKKNLSPNQSVDYETIGFRKFDVTVLSPYQMTHLNQENAQFVRSYILRELEPHGLTVSDSPDVYVDVSVVVKMQQQFSRGYFFGLPIYQVGTLTVQLMEVKEEELLWKGSKTIPLWTMKERKARKRVDTIIAKIFKNFDPSTLGNQQDLASDLGRN